MMTSSLRSFGHPPSVIRHPQWSLGFSLLDLLITLLVLALVLLMAVKQFGVYQRLAEQPAPQEQPAAAQPSAPSP